MTNSTGLDAPKNVALALFNLARTQPLKVAFIRLLDKPQLYCWRQIAHWVASACASLEQSEVRSGDHVASVLENSAEWFVFDLACQVLGLVHVAIDARWSENVVAQLLRDSDAKLVFSSHPLHQETLAGTKTLPWNWRLPWEEGPASNTSIHGCIEKASSHNSHAPAQLLFTSGTTGTPKGVLLSHRNLVSNALAKLAAAPQLQTDLRLNILPFCHAYARTCELSTWVLTGGKLAIASDWNDFLHQARELQPTLVNLVPYLVNKLVQMATVNAASSNRTLTESLSDLTGGRVRLLQVGGAALSNEVWEVLAEAGLPPLQGYGLTEASPVVCSNRAGRQRAGTIGTAVAGVEIRVDVEQQLWVRGENVMLGYYRDEQATETRIRDGWLATGDLVEQDTAGQIRIIGRISDVVVLSTGFKVAPEIIESRVMSAGWLDQLLVVGDGKPFIALLAWPNWERLSAEFCFARNHATHYSDTQSLQAALLQQISQRLLDLPPFMHPQKIGLMATPIDSSKLVNAKGNLRRRLATAAFELDIERLFLPD